MSNKYGMITNPAIKKQWLKDLRSGNLDQCTGTLCQTGTKTRKAEYCCLGVLGRSIKKIKALPVTHTKLGELIYKDDMEHARLPDSLRLDLGITAAGQTRLMQMNDNLHKNFNEIADWIEKNL